MATNTSSEGNKMLNPQDIRNILQLPPTDGKELLAKKLGIPPYNDPNDQQKGPFINYVYENICFAQEKGFPWEHISLVVKFAHEFLTKILVEKHTLADALQDFHKKSTILSPLNDRHKKQYTDFIYETVLCHYNLYKYVFSHLRNSINPVVEKVVHVPEVPPPLSEGEDVAVWEYKQKVKVVTEKEVNTKELLRGNLEKVKEDAKDHKSLDCIDAIPAPYSKMSLEELVKDVLKGYSEQKEKEMQIKAQSVVDDLTLKLEKTAIPRPVIMGSPPRFKPKSPIGVKQLSSRDSIKGEKRSAKPKSARGSTAGSSRK